MSKLHGALCWMMIKLGTKVILSYVKVVSAERVGRIEEKHEKLKSE